MVTKSFKTKIGYCYLRSSMIVLTRGDSRSTMVKYSQVVSLVVVGFQSVIGVLLLWYVDFFYAERLWLGVIAFAMMSGRLLYGSLSFLRCRHSTAPVIMKDSIRNVKFHRGVKGITRSRFDITFEDNNGKLRHRLIMLPGSLSGGGSAADARALSMMNEYFK